MALGKHWQETLRQGCSIKAYFLDVALKYCTRGLLVHTPNVKGKDECKVHQNKAAEVGLECLLAVMIY